MKLRDSQLKDDVILEEFYDKVIANYDYGENYYIILIHCAYDIPAKATDGTEMFDASEYVYAVSYTHLDVYKRQSVHRTELLVDC